MNKDKAWRAHVHSTLDDVEIHRRLTAGTLVDAFEHSNGELVIDDVAVPHKEIRSRAAATAGWLSGQGIGSHSRALIAGGTSVEFVIAYLAALKTGATVVLASPDLTASEIHRIIEDGEPDVMIAGSDVLEKIASPEIVPLLVTWGGGDAVTLADTIAVDGRSPPVSIRGDDVALLTYTSGTTGQPKAVPLTHTNLLASIRAAMWAWRWSPDDTLVHSLPLTHQHGLGGLHATLIAGSRAVFLSSFDPDRLVETMLRESATVLFAVPTIYQQLVDHFGGRSIDLPSLRLPISGSAPLPPRLGSLVEGWLGQKPLERYGTTETGLDVSNLYDDRRLGSVGVPLPGVELRIADEAEEILIRGPQVFAGYAGDAGSTEEAFVEGGWFRTGDVGRLDPHDGHLRISGRIKEVIISGGMNVFPREVELAIDEHQDVHRSVVIGVPSERWGEMVVACVVAAPGRSVDVKDLDGHVRRLLSKHKRPKHYLIRDELPTDSMGKVSRRRLIEEVGAIDE